MDNLNANDKASMFYEVRKSLIGFRLKVVFHPVLKKESTYVYVDIRESPTVGALLTKIAARFGIFENLAVSLHNLSIWTCENILVLADVDEVKIFVSFEKDIPIHQGPESNLKSICMNQNNISNTLMEPVNSQVTKEIQTSIGLNSTHHHYNGAKKETEGININQGENEQPSEKKSKPPTSGLQEVPVTKCAKNYPRGLAGFLKRLQDEQASDKKLNESITPSEPMSQDGSTVDDFSRDVSDVNDGGVDDSSEMSCEPRKRKRKRKHSKKHRENQVPVDEVDLSSKRFSYPQSIPRKHIYFDDNEDGNRNEPEEKLSNSNEVPETTLQISTRANCPKKSYKESEVTHETSRAHPVKPSTDLNNQISYVEKYKPSFRVQRAQNAVQIPHFDRTLKPKTVKNQAENEKQLGTLLMCKELNTVCQYNVKFPNELPSDTTSERNTVSNNILGRSDSQGNAVKSFSPSSTNHSVMGSKFVNEMTDATKRHNMDVSVSELESKDSYNSSALLNETKQFDKFDYSSVVPVVNSPAQMNCENGCEVQKSKNLENNNGNTDSSSQDECQVLLQFKTEGAEIQLRNLDDSWRILTSEMAVKDLPAVTVPKEGQAIVFKILYLKQNLFPTETEFLIFGHVLKFTPDTGEVALEIPAPFIEKLLDDCGEEPTLPEGIRFITGNVYNVEWLAMRCPRLLA